MKRKWEHQTAAQKISCPYCGAKPDEPCKIIKGTFYTIGTEPRDRFGNPLIHEARVNSPTPPAVKDDEGVVSMKIKEMPEAKINAIWAKLSSDTLCMDDVLIAVARAAQADALRQVNTDFNAELEGEGK